MLKSTGVRRAVSRGFLVDNRGGVDIRPIILSRLFLGAKLQHPGSGIKFYVYQDVYNHVYQDMYHNPYHHVYNHMYHHVYHSPPNPLILRPLRRHPDMHCISRPYTLTEPPICPI